MSKTLPGDKNTLLHTHPYNLNCPLPVDSRIKNLIEGLTEDPEDDPDGFIPIIELHNARLNKAHLLHKATVHTIQQKWVEGTDLEDIGKFLQSWAPESYRNYPCRKVCYKHSWV